MSQSWYDENEGRDYPFAADVVVGSLALPATAVLDAEVFLLAGTGLQRARVRLVRLERDDSVVPVFTFVFRPASEDEEGVLTELPGYSLVFNVASDAPRGATHYADLELDGDPLPDFGSGVLVTGRLEELLAATAPSTVYSAVFDEAPELEPARVHVDPYSGVLSLNLAIDPGPVIFGCDETPVVVTPDDPTVVARDIQGDLVFRAGYSIGLSLLAAGLEVRAEVGAGPGVPLENVVRIPQSSSSGSPAECLCQDAIYTVNGVGPDSGNNFKIVGGPGVNIRSDGNQIIVEVNESALFQRCAP